MKHLSSKIREHLKAALFNKLSNKGANFFDSVTVIFNLAHITLSAMKYSSWTQQSIQRDTR